MYRLPFSRPEFLDVFAAFNTVMWPAVAVLWIASLAVAIRLFVSPSAQARGVWGLLAALWASGAVYHALFFSRINAAAWLFAALFLTQAVMFATAAVKRSPGPFAGAGAFARLGAGFFLIYALAYPLLAAAEGLEFPRMPAFGVPCPTTLFTVGCLLIADRVPWRLALIPVAWALIGASSAFLLDIRTDWGLLLAATAIVAKKVRHQ